MANALGTKQMKMLIQDLEGQGCTARPTKAAGGYFIKFPNGGATTFHGSTSDHRAVRNMRAEVVRAGLNWIFDGGRK